MDTKKFQRATEIMNELNKLHERVENLKSANQLIFSKTKGIGLEQFYEKSQTFIACRDTAIRECEKRIARLEKEFNEL